MTEELKMTNNHLVLQTDFGLQDGAVSSMRGVAYNVADNIVVSDLTHGITPVSYTHLTLPTICSV